MSWPRTTATSCAPQAAHDAVAVLIEHLPPALHLVIASREDPPLPLPRLRARRQLSEVRAADLGFGVEEAATFLGAGMGQRQEREQVAALVESLTERELEVLRLLAAGRSNAGIAVELSVEQSMVKTHLIYVHSKLGVHSRTQAVARARAAAAGLTPAAGSTRFSTLRWTRPTGHAAKLTTRRSPDKEVIMTAEGWALVVSSFFAGLAAGFLGGLCTILRPMQAAMKGQEFRTFMETFLQYASNGLGKAFNYAWSGVTTIASILALVLLFDDPGSTAFVLTAIGLGVWVVGILVVSNVWKTPTYNMILAGDPDDLPADWEATRQRYFNINWIQLATTWATFALFLVALISL